MLPNQFHANSMSELLNLDQMREISGLEFMQGILDGRYPSPPIGKTLGYYLTEVAEGRVVFSGAPSFDAFNPMGTVHGGWYGTLLDSAMACAVMTKVPKGSIYTTLEYKVNIIKPIPQNRQIQAIGLTNHVGRSTGVATAEIIDAETGKLYATGSTTCIVMKM
jgi:uncharacterized protein (TIGR00369 family)